MYFLNIKNVSLNHPTDGIILNDINFSLKKEQQLAISGATGAGKTSLLRIISGLTEPDSGEVRLSGKRIAGPSEQLVPGHDDIAYLSQHFELPKFLRVEQVLEYDNFLTETVSNEIYEACQIMHLMHRDSRQVSGGERQRIALARLLTRRPSLLILDEPFSNLDMIHKNQLKEVISSIREKYKITCILVAHEPQDVLPWADRIIVLSDGIIQQDDLPENIYYHPINDHVAGLFGNYIHKNNLPLSFQRQTSKVYHRPDDFVILHSSGEGEKAIVIRSRFIGSGYHVDIRLRSATFTVFSTQNHLKAGNKIRVSLK